MSKILIQLPQTQTGKIKSVEEFKDEEQFTLQYENKKKQANSIVIGEFVDGEFKIKIMYSVFTNQELDEKTVKKLEKNILRIIGDVQSQLEAKTND